MSYQMHNNDFTRIANEHMFFKPENQKILRQMLNPYGYDLSYSQLIRFMTDVVMNHFDIIVQRFGEDERHQTIKLNEKLVHTVYTDPQTQPTHEPQHQHQQEGGGGAPTAAHFQHQGGIRLPEDEAKRRVDALSHSYSSGTVMNPRQPQGFQLQPQQQPQQPHQQQPHQPQQQQQQPHRQQPHQPHQQQPQQPHQQQQPPQQQPHQQPHRQQQEGYERREGETHQTQPVRPSQKSLIYIDSRYADQGGSPELFNVTIGPFSRGIKSIKVVSVDIPNSEFNINQYNSSFFAIVGNDKHEIVVSPGMYTVKELTHGIEDLLEESFPSMFRVGIIPASKKIIIECANPFTLEHTDRSILPVIGIHDQLTSKTNLKIMKDECIGTFPIRLTGSEPCALLEITDPHRHIYLKCHIPTGRVDPFMYEKCDEIWCSDHSRYENVQILNVLQFSWKRPTRPIHFNGYSNRILLEVDPL